MLWDEAAGRVTRAFSDWHLVDRDQRAFFVLGRRFAIEAYARRWNEISQEPADPDGPDFPDLFDNRVLGLWPHDFEWMHSAAVLRDTLTAFEVYLEKAREEILEHHGYPRSVPDRSPDWNELCSFFSRLGATVETPDVYTVRELRHFLTHRRGELRSEKLRQQFAPSYAGIPPIVVELSEHQVVAAMDTLADAVRRVDAVAYRYSWGRFRIPELKLGPD